MVGTPHNGHSMCTDPGTQHRDGGNLLIMGTVGVQIRELSTGMVGTSHNGHRGCTDPAMQHRDGKN
ncbi:unnamed protein product, partial [Staurois parvus]